MAYKTTDAFAAQFFDDNGAPAEGHTLTFLVTGTSTPASIAFDTAGSTTATTVTIGANGFPQNSGSDVEIYFNEATTYDIVRKDSGGTAYGPTVSAFTVASSSTALTALGVLSAAGSGVNAIVADLTSPPTSLTDQLQVIVELQHGANTSTSVTFNLNSLGAKTVKRNNNEALLVGDTGGAGAKLYLSYSATNDVWILLNPMKRDAADVVYDNSASGLTATDIQAGLDEIVADATKLSYDNSASGLAATNLQAALDEIVSEGEKVLTSGSIGAAADLEFILSTLDSTQSVYNRYKIYLFNFLPATDDVRLTYTLTSDAGVTDVSTGYYGIAEGRDSANSQRTNAWSNASQGESGGDTEAGSGFGNAAGENANAVIELMGMNTGASVKPRIAYQVSFWDANATSRYVEMEGSGSNSAAADYDSIKFAFTSGNFTANGYYAVTKMAKP